MLSRKNFIVSAASMMVLQRFPVQAASERPNLRVGVLSDIHVKRDRSAEVFRSALEYFRDWNVDAVLITGDLTTNSQLCEFEDVARIWFEVFPDDRGADGTHVERLFLTGNHDVDGYLYGGWVPASFEEAKEQSFFFNRRKFWKHLFKEDYAPVVLKEVKGYKFVLRNWFARVEREFAEHPLFKGHGIALETSPLNAWFAVHGAELPKDKPFFFCQHEPPKGTCSIMMKDTFDDYDGDATVNLCRFPNAVALSGHLHESLLKDHTIWQGAFMSVGCSATCGWEFTNAGRVNGHSCYDDDCKPEKEMPPLDFQSCHQGMVMEVFDDRIVFKKRDFEHGCPLCPDWVVPLGAGVEQPYRWEVSSARSKAPQFSAEAQVTCRFIADGQDRGGNRHPQVEVSFPPVNGTTGWRAFDFEVEARYRIDDVERSLRVERVYSPNALQPAEYDCEPVHCRFTASVFPGGRAGCWGEVRFVVTPMNEWGLRGRPISSDWMKDFPKCLSSSAQD